MTARASVVFAVFGCPANSESISANGMSVSSSKYIRMTPSGTCMNFFIMSNGDSEIPM